MTWHCLYTDPRCEWRVAGDLFIMGYEVLTLYRMVRVAELRKSVKVKRWFYPRYVFASLPTDPADKRIYENAVADVITLRGVHHMLGTYRGPLKVPESVIAKLRSRADPDGLVDLPDETIRRRIRAGTAVRISDGPLAGLFVLVIQDLGDEIEAWVQAFGRDRVKARFSPAALGLVPAA